MSYKIFLFSVVSISLGCNMKENSLTDAIGTRQTMCNNQSVDSSNIALGDIKNLQYKNGYKSIKLNSSISDYEDCFTCKQHTKYFHCKLKKYLLEKSSSYDKKHSEKEIEVFGINDTIKNIIVELETLHQFKIKPKDILEKLTILYGKPTTAAYLESIKKVDSLHTIKIGYVFEGGDTHIPDNDFIVSPTKPKDAYGNWQRNSSAPADRYSSYRRELKVIDGVIYNEENRVIRVKYPSYQKFNLKWSDKISLNFTNEIFIGKSHSSQVLKLVYSCSEKTDKLIESYRKEERMQLELNEKKRLQENEERKKRKIIQEF